MKKIFVLVLTAIMLASCGGSKKEKSANNTQQETTVEDNTYVKSLDYKTFVKKVWDIERYPDSFAYQGKLPCIIDFYADWCGPCKKVAPIMEEMAQKYEDEIIIYKVNVDKEQKLPTIFKVRNIPTVFFFPMDEQPLSQVGALSKEEYENLINKHLIK